MNHLYTIIWLRNMERQKELQKDLQKQNIQNNIQKNNIEKNNIQKNETTNKIVKKEPVELYSNDDIEKLLLIM